MIDTLELLESDTESKEYKFFPPFYGRDGCSIQTKLKVLCPLYIIVSKPDK